VEYSLSKVAAAQGSAKLPEASMPDTRVACSCTPCHCEECKCATCKCEACKECNCPAVAVAEQVSPGTEGTVPYQAVTALGTTYMKPANMVARYQVRKVPGVVTKDRFDRRFHPLHIN
jgi:hypothetical protein